jgi:hypothetical protein
MVCLSLLMIVNSPFQPRKECMLSTSKCMFSLLTHPPQPKYYKMQFFIVELAHSLALYRKGYYLKSGIFVNLAFIKTVKNFLNSHCTDSQQRISLNLCEHITHNFHSIVREINSKSEAHTSVLLSKTLVLLDDKNIKV